MRLSKQEIQDQINNTPILCNEIWIHKRSGDRYKVTQVGYHVTSKSIEVSYIPEEEGFPIFLREAGDFLNKFRG